MTDSAPRAADEVTADIHAALGEQYPTLSAFVEALLAEKDERRLDTMIGEAATLLHHFEAKLKKLEAENARLHDDLKKAWAGQATRDLQIAEAEARADQEWNKAIETAALKLDYCQLYNIAKAIRALKKGSDK